MRSSNFKPLTTNQRALLICLFLSLLSTHNYAQQPNEIVSQSKHQQNINDNLALTQIMQMSGLRGQLKALTEELRPHIEKSFKDCGLQSGSEFPDDFASRYTFDDLNNRARDFLKSTLNEETLSVVSSWLLSPEGVQIIEAERIAATWTADEFDKRIAASQVPPQWNKQRRQALTHFITATGADRYVASLSASETEFLRLLSQCSTGFSAENRNAALNRIDNDRVLIAVFIRMDLLAPTGAVMHEIPDSVLHAYIKFASTREGQHFHQTLARVFENVLLDD